ncbi:2TM domain-containing protein [Flavobacterium ammonificans]|uniref:Histidine kinase n=1 Tax=Flavobacterium ammonificans TaxID=1751056 RepID=A0ABM7V182_9FLAO|nr:2TM domain-containing protein [Flavobacterium ammonificans]BDB53535.1 histidine kinase [Flavobacterium ammonificans]
MGNNNLDQIRYEEAVKKVKKLKGFYTHALVYVVINIMIVIANVQNLDPGESYFQFKNFFTAFFWGIGLLAHAMGTFIPYFILGKDWEERKIKELMEKERNVNKWE